MINMNKLILVFALFAGLALGQTSYYGLTLTKTGAADPTGVACTNTLEFAVNGTKWLACVGGVWAVIGGGGGSSSNNESWTVSFCSSGVCNNDTPLNRKPIIYGSTHAVKCTFDAKVAPSNSVKVDMKRTDGTSVLNLTGGVELNGATFPLVFTAATPVTLVAGTDTLTFTLVGISGQGITASCYSN